MEWEGEEKSEMRCVLNLDKHNYTQLAMCIAHLHAVACGKVGALGTLVARRLSSSRSPDTWRGQAWDCLRPSFSAGDTERAQGQIRQPRASSGHALIISHATLACGLLTSAGVRMIVAESGEVP